MELSARLQELLKKKEMSQKELSIKAGITEAALSHYIKGDRFPRSNTIAALAAALDTSVDYLLGTIPGKEVTDEYNTALTLIARNAQHLTHEQKMKIVGLLLKD